MSGRTGFWRTLVLLLTAARARAHGRAGRQRRLLGMRGTSASWSAGTLTVLAVLFAGLLHGAMGGMIIPIVSAGQRARAEAAGQVVISRACYAALERYGQSAPEPEAYASYPDLRHQQLRVAFHGEGRRAHAEDREQYEIGLVSRYERLGLSGFEREPRDLGLVDSAATISPVATWLGSTLCVFWFLMLAFQSEGFDLDVQRRRHPMIEWLFSHPVSPAAVFVSEMLAPLVANPMYWMAPLFWVVLYTVAYDNFGVGLYAGLAVGVPFAAAAGCCGKAFEVYAQFRLPPRTRGAVLGLLGWLGYSSMIITFLIATSRDALDTAAAWLSRVGVHARLPLLEWALGLGDTASAWRGVGACVGASSLVIALATFSCVRATRRGLSGAFGDAPADSVVLTQPQRLERLRDPMLRKELLWLWRDRGALVQAFLIPLSIAALQLVNIRSVTRGVTWTWNVMAGAVVLFAAYFIQLLGPRSLTSEGSALWITLTWPRGLDTLLKAKARLWWMITCLFVLPVLVFAALRAPADAWKLALVGLIWAIHGNHLSERAVTLVRVPSSSGEIEPIPRGKQWAASIGTLAVGVGLLSAQWNVVITGVVYTWLVSAAQWQSFRAHLPYLFDPWSEKLPEPPTLTQAMLATYAIFEMTGIVLAIALTAAGSDGYYSARAWSYGVCTGLGGLITHNILQGRGLRLGDVLRFEATSPRVPKVALFTLAALALGAALALAARAYIQLLLKWPQLGEVLQREAHQLARPGDIMWLLLAGVVFAPLAEEYLFRGLLFRALHREWKDARAIWGSALFFAIYHPPVAWIPVALVGATAAWLFKQAGHLVPSVILHMTYNACVFLLP